MQIVFGTRLASSLKTACLVSAGCWLLSLPSNAIAGECQGAVNQRHDLNVFRFETNSRALSDEPPFARLETCVKNLDPVVDLFIHWYVPAMRTWVPPGEIVEWPRMVEGGVPRLPLHGCIEYGNVGRRTVAQFIGTPAEKQEITQEQGLDCQGAVRAQAGPPPASPPSNLNIRLPRKIFFPSDAKRAKETMLTLIGEAGVTAKGDNFYMSYLSYQVEQYPGRPEGEPAKVRIRPSFTGPNAASLLSQFESQAKNSNAALGTKGGFSFTTQVMRDATLSNAALDLIDANDRVVGSISFPIVVSGDRSRGE